jgi:hypothetical protein
MDHRRRERRPFFRTVQARMCRKPASFLSLASSTEASRHGLLASHVKNSGLAISQTTQNNPAKCILIEAIRPPMKGTSRPFNHAYLSCFVWCFDNRSKWLHRPSSMCQRKIDCDVWCMHRLVIVCPSLLFQAKRRCRGEDQTVSLCGRNQHK